MATFSEDFEAQTVGNFPTGWTNRWAAFTATVQTGGLGRVLDWLLNTTARRAATFDAAGSFTDGEICAKFIGGSTFASGSSFFWLDGRVSGASSTETSVWFNIGNSGGNYQINLGQYSGGTSTSLATAVGIAATLLASNFYVRFKWAGTTTQAKIWAEGAAEPSAWTITSTTAATVTGAGTAGVGANSGNGTTDIKCDGIGFATTSAESAPTPTAGTSGGGTATKFASITLKTAAGANQANLSNLRWAFFDTTDLTALAAPSDKAATGTTDANGLFKGGLFNATTAVGGSGTLLVQTGDGLSGGVFTASVTA